MLNLLRNKDVRNPLIIALALTIGLTLPAILVNPLVGGLVGVLGIALTVLFLGYSYRRYQRLASMASQIDRILHGNEPFDLSEFAEGELSILQTEIQKMTVMLREQAANLQKDKLYLSNSIADISHQIRTPLTTLAIVTELLSRPDLDYANRLKQTNELETQLSRIDWLTTALLRISKIDTGTAVFKQQPVQVEQLIDEALKPLAIALDLHDIELTRNGAGTVNCDLAWTAEAIGNILKNCLEHSSAGGSIIINTEENPVFTEIVIQDTGRGFAEEDLPHLFERFYKGGNSSESSYGIGLALSQLILAEQNATIKASANQPHGARFIVRFYHQQTL